MRALRAPEPGTPPVSLARRGLGRSGKQLPWGNQQRTRGTAPRAPPGPVAWQKRRAMALERTAKGRGASPPRPRRPGAPVEAQLRRVTALRRVAKGRGACPPRPPWAGGLADAAGKQPWGGHVRALRAPVEVLPSWAWQQARVKKHALGHQPESRLPHLRGVCLLYDGGGPEKMRGRHIPT